MQNPREEDENGKRRRLRDRGLRYAVVTSILARVAGVLLQVLSLPVAANKLGAIGFGAYAMYSALLSAMTISNVGVGQATTLHMSRALATGEYRLSNEIFSASLVIMGGISTVVSFAALIIIYQTPIIELAFSQYLAALPAPQVPAVLLCFIFFSNQMLSIVEAAQLAHQRQHRLNLTLCLGTSAAACAVWSVAENCPSVVNILLAVHLPVIGARILNAGGVWLGMSPDWQDLPSSVRRIRSIMLDGIRFVSGTSISNFLCHPLSILIVGVYESPLESASFAAVMSALVLGSSLNSLVAIPLRAAIPEAHRNVDREWLRKSLTLLYGVHITCGMLVFVGLSAFGEVIFEVWYGGVVAPSRFDLVAAGFYFFILSLEGASFTYLSSTGFLVPASRAVVVKAVISASLVYVVAASGFADHVFWILSICNLAFVAIPHSFMLKNATQR